MRYDKEKRTFMVKEILETKRCARVRSVWRTKFIHSHAPTNDSILLDCDKSWIHVPGRRSSPWMRCIYGKARIDQKSAKSTGFSRPHFVTSRTSLRRRFFLHQLTKHYHRWLAPKAVKTPDRPPVEADRLPKKTGFCQLVPFMAHEYVPVVHLSRRRVFLSHRVLKIAK